MRQRNFMNASLLLFAAAAALAAQGRAPRIAVGGILHESNTFSQELTDLDDFRSGMIRRGDEIEKEFAHSAHEVGGFIEGAQKFGLRLVPTIVANATPAGPVTDQALDSLTAELIERIQKAGRLDGLLLALHGAMVTESHADGDAEVLRRLRSALGGELPIVVTHDAHANVAPEEIRLSTALVIYKEVPHIDQRERGVQAAEIMARIVNEGVRPTQAIEKPPLLYNILYHNTKREPMLPLVEEARRLERENPKILAVSVPVGYQYADVPQMGPSVVVVTDGDMELARKEARRLAALMWEHRHVMKLDLPDAREAVRRAMAAEKTPVVLVEMGDNIGGGSAGDSTFLLRELVDQKAQGYVSAIYDPEAVQAAARAGIGGNFDLDVGGKTDALHGDPVRIRGRVKMLYDGEYVETAARHGGRRYLDQGLTAVIHAEGSTADLPNVVLLNSKRHTPFSLGQLTSAGVQPERQKILVVKAAVAFRAAYEPIAGTIIEVDTAGLTAVNPKRFTYKRARPELHGLR
jgi:microcystin degradation protein MlrC